MKNADGVGASRGDAADNRRRKVRKGPGPPKGRLAQSLSKTLSKYAQLHKGSHVEK